MWTPSHLLPLLGILALPLTGCGGSGGGGGELEGEPEMAPQEVEQVTLGPRDGQDLPATDLERVAVGTTAPDFSLTEGRLIYEHMCAFRIYHL